MSPALGYFTWKFKLLPKEYMYAAIGITFINRSATHLTQCRFAYWVRVSKYEKASNAKIFSCSILPLHRKPSQHASESRFYRKCHTNGFSRDGRRPLSQRNRRSEKIRSHLPAINGPEAGSSCIEYEGGT